MISPYIEGTQSRVSLTAEKKSPYLGSPRSKVAFSSYIGSRQPWVALSYHKNPHIMDSTPPPSCALLSQVNAKLCRENLSTRPCVLSLEYIHRKTATTYDGFLNCCCELCLVSFRVSVRRAVSILCAHCRCSYLFLVSWLRFRVLVRRALSIPYAHYRLDWRILPPCSGHT